MFELTVSHIDNLINTNKFSWKDLEKLIEMRKKLSKNNNELYKDQEMTNLLKTLIEFFQKWENSIDWWYKIEENTSWTWQIFNLWDKEDLQSFKIWFFIFLTSTISFNFSYPRYGCSLNIVLNLSWR